MKVFGISLLFVSLFSLFLSVERCSNNSSNVEAMNRQIGNSPFGRMTKRLDPAMPAISKYGLFFFVVCGAAGIVVLSKYKEEKKTVTDYMKIKTQQKLDKSNKEKES